MEKSCGTITINNKQVLLVRQKKGHISFPKGHIEKGESEKETAVRETYEETGIKVKILDDSPRYTVYYPINEGVKEVIFFIAKVIDSHNITPQESEIDEVLWKDINQVKELLTYQNMKDLWDQVLKDIL